MTLSALSLLVVCAFAGQKALTPVAGLAAAPGSTHLTPTLNQTLSLPMPEFAKMDGAQSAQAVEADFHQRAQLGETIKPQSVEPVLGGDGAGARPLANSSAQTPAPEMIVPVPKTAPVNLAPKSSFSGAVVTMVRDFFRGIFATPERVPFTPTPGRHYYHGTSWVDLMDIVAKDGALAPKITFLARGHHQSEPYGDARALKKRSKTIVLEFEDDPVDGLNHFSGSPVGAYPAYRAHSPVPLWALTPASKKAVLDEYDRQGDARVSRERLLDVLGL